MAKAKKAVPRSAARGPDRLAGLSFIAMRDGKTLPKPKGAEWPRCFWHVKATGDYAADVIKADKAARDFLAHEASVDHNIEPPLLPWIIADMPRELTHIEIHFLTVISLATASGAKEGQRVVNYWGRPAAQAACSPN